MIMKRFLLAAAVAVSFTSASRATVPTPEPGFGTAGTAVLTFSELGGFTSSLAIQPDGKPVIGYGNVFRFGGFGAPFGTQGFLARLSPDGSVDTSLFGGPIAEHEVPHVLVQRDSRILIAVSKSLARYLPDGVLDSRYTFNATTATNSFDPVLTFVDFTLQADGKVWALGYVGTVNGRGEGSQATEIVRFNTDGTLDTSFGAAGHVRIPVTAGFDVPVAMAALPQGKVGVAISRVIQDTTPTVLRVNGDGTLDSTFGVGGQASTSPGEVAEALAVQSDGRMLLATGRPGNLNPIVRVRRFTNAGTTDLSFGVFGSTVQPVTNAAAQPARIAVQPDDKFLLSTNGAVKVTRYGRNGAVDATFGDDGSVSPDALRSVSAIELGPDGSVWVAGESTQPAAGADISARGNPAVAHFVGGATATIEYYNAGLDHYFISANPQETTALDLGLFQGWVRTGLSFNVLGPSALKDDATVPVCRFYIPPPFGDSHFFSASEAECGQVASRFPSFILETPQAMRVGLPDPATGACSPSMPVPVYRAWDGRPDTNHRYTASMSARDAMAAKGWIAEGYGPDAVAMCGSSSE
jgi:uncharacterized delta-60 repeat protein